MMSNADYYRVLLVKFRMAVAAMLKFRLNVVFQNALRYKL